MKNALRAAAICVALATTAQALINPNFTPIHMAQQSGRILHVKLGAAGADGRRPMTVVKALKGEAPGAMWLSLAKTDRPQVEHFNRHVAAGEHPAILFTGQFKEQKETTGGEDEGPPKGSAFLHVNGRWFSLVAQGADTFMIDILSEPMQATWAGGTDMLLRAMEYVLTDPSASVPCATDTSWNAPVQAGKVAGSSRGVLAVDLKGDGRIAALILSDQGDRVLQFANGAWADTTASLKLTSRSVCACVGDFNADGRLDIASSDGKSITLHHQAEDGTFSGKPLDAKLADVIGMATIAGPAGRAAILISTRQAPRVLVPADPKSEIQNLGSQIPDLGSALGDAFPCLIADFDGDDVIDVLQPFAKGSLLYKGQAAGGFDTPRAVAVSMGAGPAGACTGDFDADGLTDVLVAGSEFCSLWHNLGNGRFVETMGLSGEPAYISKPKAVIAQTCDINNDGLQDFFVGYSAIAPHLFFNRGFRSFGHSHSLDLLEHETLKPAHEGIQSGIVADFNADGFSDMLLVLKDGHVHALMRNAGDRTALGVRVALPARSGLPGPVSIKAQSGKRALGAWTLNCGTELLLARPEPGPISFTWRSPGGAQLEHKALIEDTLLRREIGKDGAK